MSAWREFRAFLRAFRRRAGSKAKAPDSLAKTLKESTHVRGARGGMPRAGTEQHHKIVAEGHERYTESFEDD